MRELIEMNFIWIYLIHIWLLSYLNSKFFYIMIESLEMNNFKKYFVNEKENFLFNSVLNIYQDRRLILILLKNAYIQV
jgi:hypothetical protein